MSNNNSNNSGNKRKNSKYRQNRKDRKSRNRSISNIRNKNAQALRKDAIPNAIREGMEGWIGFFFHLRRFPVNLPSIPGDVLLAGELPKQAVESIGAQTLGATLCRRQIG